MRGSGAWVVEDSPTIKGPKSPHTSFKFPYGSLSVGFKVPLKTVRCMAGACNNSFAGLGTPVGPSTIPRPNQKAMQPQGSCLLWRISDLCWC